MATPPVIDGNAAVIDGNAAVIDGSVAVIDGSGVAIESGLPKTKDRQDCLCSTRTYFICSGRLSARRSLRRSFVGSDSWPECSPGLEPS
jgi:hypothetical protein